MACEGCPILQECVARELLGVEVLDEGTGEIARDISPIPDLSSRDAAMVQMISETPPGERLGHLVDQEVCKGPRKQFFLFGKMVCTGKVYATLDGKTPFPMDITRKLK